MPWTPHFSLCVRNTTCPTVLIKYWQKFYTKPFPQQSKNGNRKSANNECIRWRNGASSLNAHNKPMAQSINCPYNLTHQSRCPRHRLLKLHKVYVYSSIEPNDIRILFSLLIIFLKNFLIKMHSSAVGCTIKEQIT